MIGKISNLKQIASISRYTVTEGREAGLDIIDCNNGKLRFLLNVTKALDVMQMYHEGQNLSFLSKNAFNAREVNFLNRFEGGMMYTCGLDSIGGREGYELHGSHHNQRAEVVRAECDESGIVVEAIVRETALFGQNLVFRRRVTSAVNSTSVEITDTLENAGFSDADFVLLYHINIGYPMLDEGARVVCDTKSVTPRTPFSAEHLDDALKMSDAVVGQEEMCYYLEPENAKVSLVNEKLGKTFTVSYSKETLPIFIEWKSMASGDYALGLEPATSKLDDGFAYTTLKPSEKKNFKITLSVE